MYTLYTQIICLLCVRTCTYYTLQPNTKLFWFSNSRPALIKISSVFLK